MKTIHWILLFFVFGATPASAQTPAKPAAPLTTASISGRVTLNGKPVAGTLVTLMGDSYFGNPAGSAVTDPEGRFTIQGVFSGSYDLRVGFGVVSRENAVGSLQSVTLAPDQVLKDVEIRLRPGGVITGRVTDGGDHPVPNQIVTILRIPQNTGMARPDNFSVLYFNKPEKLRTDTHGVYRVSGLPPGHYIVGVGDVVLEGQGGIVRDQTIPATFHPHATDWQTATVIELAAGEVAVKRDIRTGQPEKTFTISGQLTDAVTGAPVGGMTVEISYRSGQGEHILMNLGESNPTGGFRLTGIKPGTYRVFVSDEKKGNEYLADSIPVTIRTESLNLTIRLRRGATISGRINLIGKADLALFSRCSIAAYPVFGKEGFSVRFGTVETDGTFRIIGLPPGTYRIHPFPPEGVRIRFQLLELQQGGNDLTETGLTVGAEPIGDIRITAGIQSGLVYGKLQFTGNEPPPGSRYLVILQPVELPAQCVAFDITNRNHHFLIDYVIPGIYTVKIIEKTQTGPDAVLQTFTPTTVTVPATGEMPLLLNVDLSGERPPR